ncbi:hypothetical protein E4P29_10780 [Rhodococcus sp. 1R11]|uniref:hypothetical protein n=1 Tax=Rhodococcus sp. 1R11 TaxID=2559614 RepID=UPI0010726A27|nr:hypothetical protein [Rhodococcus sp. 1R11]TFI43495.1 hypothetical protein E4P29_10780 [Rhodococcus sp. 1R11]
MNVAIPADDDNFLRRECPTCEQQFKLKLGPANAEGAGEPSAETYFCPLCGVPAGAYQWWTKEQLDYAQARAMPDILAQLSNESGLEITQTGDVPEAMVEPNDMDIVQSPCHPEEPVKVPSEHRQSIHCLVCGSSFTV